MSNDTDPIIETIRENVRSAKRAKGDNGEMEQHALAEQIAVDRYLRSLETAKAGPSGLRFTKVIPPGSA